MLADLKSLSLLQYKAEWQTARVHQLSHNIANAETPNYQRRDLKDFNSVLKAHAAELRQRKTGGLSSFQISKSDEIQPKGEVVREKEVLHLTEEVTEHQATMQLMKKMLSMLRTVAGK